MYRAVAIDLGTANCRVAMFDEGCVEVIENDEGKRSFTSCVAYADDGRRLVGSAAKYHINEANIVSGVKRRLGFTFSTRKTSGSVFYWQNSHAKLAVGTNGTTLFPEEVAAMLLSKMKKAAERRYNCTVSDAVITVSAMFNDAQRQAMRDAAAIAGLNTLRILNEPTAALLAYTYDNQTKGRKAVVVVDFGAGKLDVTFARLNNGQVEVESSYGDYIGGQQIDDALAKDVIDHHLPAQFRTQENVQKLKRRVLHACERAKIALSGMSDSRIEFNAGDLELSIGITQQRLEGLCSHLFDEAEKVLRTAISQSAWGTTTGIAADFVHLVGGSSRIPRFQRLVADVFVGTDVRKSNYVEEAVVRGAAVAAAMLSGSANATLKGLRISDVLNTPIVCKRPAEALSDVVHQSPFAFVFERNTRLPTMKTIEFRKDFSTEPELFSEIRHGDTEAENDNLCTIVFQCRQKARAEIRVNLLVDEDGILRMSLHSANIHSVRGILASELNTVEQMLRPKAMRDRRAPKLPECNKRDKLGAVSMTVDKAALTPEEIDALRSDLAVYYENETRRDEVDDARNELEAECRAINRRLQNDVDDHTGFARAVVDECNSAFQWLHDSESDRPLLATRERLEKLRDAYQSWFAENAATDQPPSVPEAQISSSVSVGFCVVPTDLASTIVALSVISVVILLWTLY